MSAPIKPTISVRKATQRTLVIERRIEVETLEVDTRIRTEVEDVVLEATEEVAMLVTVGDEGIIVIIAMIEVTMRIHVVEILDVDVTTVGIDIVVPTAEYVSPTHKLIRVTMIMRILMSMTPRMVSDATAVFNVFLIVMIVIISMTMTMEIG
jgi:hypothetical protein